MGSLAVIINKNITEQLVMDKITPEKRSRIMSQIKGKNTKLEISVRRYLFSLGYRYSIKNNLMGKPDILFENRRIAIFVNGCFWHAHGCKYSHIPKSNLDYWQKKLDRNRIRDETVRSFLDIAGYRVITLWECKLKDSFNEEMNDLVKTLGNTRFRRVHEIQIPK